MRTPFVRRSLVALAALLITSVVFGFALLLFGARAPQIGSVNEPHASSQVASPASNDMCASPEQVRTLISEFINGYDNGQPGLADRFFATAPDFQWYSEQPLREGASAYDRSTLEAYLRQRYADGDRLAVVSVQFNSVRGGIGNFGFLIDRGGTQLLSKGALDCRSGRFIVWSIGPNAGPVP